jgi:hypothetical protein
MKKVVALITVIISLCAGLYTFFTGNKNSVVLPVNIAYYYLIKLYTVFAKKRVLNNFRIDKNLSIAF